MAQNDTQKEEKIELSKYSLALIDNFTAIKSKAAPDEMSKINVSQTVSFFALAYERVRNAVEYRESHLIRRAAIERILKRRLALNPEGEGEAENLIRELLWARYFTQDSLGEGDIENVQKVIDRYRELQKTLLVGRPDSERSYLSQFLFDLLTCEIEEVLTPIEAKKQSLKIYYLFQVLKEKIKIDGVDEATKNAFFYVALERSFSKSDLPYLRFHLFELNHSLISRMDKKELAHITANFVQTAKQIDQLIQNPYSDRILRYVRVQMPPFRILFELLEKEGSRTKEILSEKTTLFSHIDQICREKYDQTRGRLRSLGIKAIIYIFLTKMILAFILEYPLSQALFGEVNYLALAINTLFPPLLMFLIIGATKVPDEENTRRIHERLIDIIDADKSFETQVGFVIRKARVRRRARVFSFTVFYSFTFLVTFLLLYVLLSLLNFNAISQLVFIFFVSLVTFFAYRIRQIAKEYMLKEKEGILAPLTDFFFLPILSLGKFLSSNIARLNFFTVLFDFFIEAPFKLIFEVLEDWIKFVRQRKDEII